MSSVRFSQANCLLTGCITSGHLNPPLCPLSCSTNFSCLHRKCNINCNRESQVMSLHGGCRLFSFISDNANGYLPRFFFLSNFHQNKGFLFQLFNCIHDFVKQNLELAQTISSCTNFLAAAVESQSCFVQNF